MISDRPAPPSSVQKANSLTAAKSTTAAVLAVALLGGAIWISYARPIFYCALLQEDALDAAFCGTYDKLGDYEERPEEAIDWLLVYHGEAPSAQVMFMLLDWAEEEQDSFIDVLSRLDDEDADSLIERLTHAGRQSGQNDQFAKAFSARRNENERLRKILERMAEPP